MKRLRPFADVLIAGVLIIAVDVAMYHLRGWVRWLRVDSYSGQIEQHSRRFRAMREAKPGRPAVVILGDSSTGASVQEVELEEALASSRLGHYVVNLAQGGSSPRAWHVVLRNEDITSRTTDAVVLGVFMPSLWKRKDAWVDVEIVKSRLGLADAPLLAASCPEIEARLEVLYLALYRTPLFRKDLRNFFHDPAARVESVRESREFEHAHPTGWRRRNQAVNDLSSARLGPDGRLVLNELRGRLRHRPDMHPPVEQALQQIREGRQARAQEVQPEKERMLERCIRLLHARGVHVVLAVTPYGPYPVNRHDTGSIRALVARLKKEGIDVALHENESMLQHLESPRYFRDPLHLNAMGASEYTRDLGAFLTRHLNRRSPENASGSRPQLGHPG